MTRLWHDVWEGLACVDAQGWLKLAIAGLALFVGALYLASYLEYLEEERRDHDA